MFTHVLDVHVRRNAYVLYVHVCPQCSRPSSIVHLCLRCLGFILMFLNIHALHNVHAHPRSSHSSSLFSFVFNIQVLLQCSHSSSKFSFIFNVLVQLQCLLSTSMSTFVLNVHVQLQCSRSTSMFLVLSHVQPYPSLKIETYQDNCSIFLLISLLHFLFNFASR